MNRTHLFLWLKLVFCKRLSAKRVRTSPPCKHGFFPLLHRTPRNFIYMYRLKFPKKVVSLQIKVINGCETVLKSVIVSLKQNILLLQPPFRSKATNSLLPSCLAGIAISGNFTVRVYYVLPDLSGLNCILSRAICLKFICLFSKIRFYSSEGHRSFISALNNTK